MHSEALKYQHEWVPRVEKPQFKRWDTFPQILFKPNSKPWLGEAAYKNIPEAYSIPLSKGEFTFRQISEAQRLLELINEITSVYRECRTGGWDGDSARREPAKNSHEFGLQVSQP